MSEFRMPSLGADMEAGTLVEWLKRPGDKVTRGDIVAVVETEKGAIEVEIFEDGVVEKLLVEPGAKVPVGTPLAVVGAGGKAVPPAATPPAPRTEPTPKPKPPPAAAPRPAAAAPAPASPAARRLAAERGVDLVGIAGSGPGGAIVTADVERAAGPAPAAKGIDRTGMRRAIAAAMARSKREIPHYYLGAAIDLSRALAWLEAANAERPPARRLLLAVLLLKAVARALGKTPELNGYYVEGGFRPSERVHVGMAVALRGGGLVAPAIHDTDRLPLDELMEKLRDLVARVRAGGLRSSEIADPTVTVTSLGERGVDTIFGVIYPPQVAIVGFGAPRPRPWPTAEGLASRPVVTATLSADHRVSDGHRGALFLAEVDRLLQDPEAL